MGYTNRTIINNQNQRIKGRSNKFFEVIILLGVALFLVLQLGCTSDRSTATKDAMEAARAKGYSVYENSVQVLESDGYGRYFISLRARQATVDIQLIVFIHAITEIRYTQLVCPDMFNSAAERSQWIADVKYSNDWGINAK